MNLTRTGKRRLLKLADLLERDAKRKKGIKFNIGLWGDVSDPDNPMSCGTRACAMGLAAISGAFKRQGLGYIVGTNGHICFRLGEHLPYGNGFIVAMHLFEIDQAAASYLFFSDYGLPKGGRGAAAERAVAKKIRKFVETDGHIPTNSHKFPQIPFDTLTHFGIVRLDMKGEPRV